jgi:hypothetical protein
MRKIIAFAILWLTVATLAYSQNNYYWYKANKINLNTDSTIFYLRYKKSSITPQLIKSEIAAIFKIDNSAIHQLSDSEFTIQSKAKIDAGTLVEQATNLKYIAPLLKNNNATMVVLPSIVVELKEGHSIEEVLNLYRNNLTLIKNKGFNTYELQGNGKSFREILDISNALYEKSGIVVWSEPEFYSNYKPDDDPLYPNQYYLHNTGQYGGVSGIDINVEPAWIITKGCNTLRIAVIDEGVEDHEDFTGRVLAGFTAGATTREWSASKWSKRSRSSLCWNNSSNAQ